MEPEKKCSDISMQDEAQESIRRILRRHNRFTLFASPDDCLAADSTAMREAGRSGESRCGIDTWVARGIIESPVIPEGTLSFLESN